MTETLDAALKARLRAVLDHGSVTEAALRKLSEEGEACVRILDARLARSERRLERLSADGESSLAAIASEVRLISELRPDLEELHELLAQLEAHARELRVSWLTASGS